MFFIREYKPKTRMGNLVIGIIIIFVAICVGLHFLSI